MTELIKPTRKGANLKEPLLPLPCPYVGPFTVISGDPNKAPEIYGIEDSEGTPTICALEKEEADWVCAAFNEAWNRRLQSPPVAQVEVYRKALEMISHHEDCLCKPGMEVVKEALLTSKPEPVAKNMKYCSCGHDASYHSEEAEGETVVMCSGVGLFCLECSKSEVAPVRKWEAEEEK